MYMYEFFYLFERSELLLFRLYHREGKGDKKKTQVKWFLILIKKTWDVNQKCPYSYWYHSILKTGALMLWMYLVAL